MPAGNAVTLFISSLGYESLEIAMTPSADTSQRIIRISPGQQVLGEIVVVGAIQYLPKPRRSPLEIARSVITPDSIRIFPNPVALGNNIDMELKINQPGNYYVEITDFSGRLVMKKEVRVNAKVFQSSIPTKQFLTGRYIVCVRNSEGRKIGVKKIIVQ